MHVLYTSASNTVIQFSLAYQLFSYATDRQTDRSENITSFFGGGNNWSRIFIIFLTHSEFRNEFR